jgi:hypothetical protein
MHLLSILFAIAVAGLTLILALGQAQNAHLFTKFERVETVCVGLLAIAIILAN